MKQLELFGAGFLESLRGLRIVARRVPRGGRHADQRSLDLGSGIEFRDFRPYAPGDDFRAIDWNIYRRLGRVFLRLFEELEDLPLYVMPDVSDSMFLENPPRAHAGLRAALALAAISLNQHDPVGLYPFGDGLVDTRRPKAGKRHVLPLAQALEKLEPAGATDLVGALQRFEALRLRPGLLAIVSDFFDPAGADAIVAQLRRSRHRLLLVQLVRATDRAPALEGDVRLLDCETRHAEDVTVTPAVLARYRDAYDRFCRTLADGAAQRAAGLVRLDVEGDVVGQLAGLFEGGEVRRVTAVLGLVALAAVLYALQRLRVRHKDVVVPTTLFWKEAVEETQARVLVRRFRHPWAYALVLLAASLLWLGFTGVFDAERRADRATVFLLDGSDAMAGDAFAAAIARLERAVEAAPAGAVTVVFCGARPRTLLRPGEQPVLLRRRLAHVAPEPAPATVDTTLRELAAARRDGPPHDVVVFGAAPVSPVVRDALPAAWTLARATPPRAPKRALHALGVAEAASGAWDAVDVLVATGGAVPALDLDGAPLAADAARVVLRDVPARGGVLRARTPDGAAQLVLPDRPRIRVRLPADAPAPLRATLAADPGVALVAGEADVVVGRDLAFVPAADQPDAFLVRHATDADATTALMDALRELGLEDVDATGLATAAGRPVSLGVARGDRRRVSVWRELLTERYNFTASRAFPLFVARAVRWLAGAGDFAPYVAAGETVAPAADRYVGPDGESLATAGAPFAPPRAGVYRAPDGNALAATLFQPASFPDEPAVPLAPAPGGGGGWPAATWLGLAALLLLAGEWFLFRTGRIP